MRRAKRTGKYLSLLNALILVMILTACGAQGEEAVTANHENRQEDTVSEIEPKKELQDQMPADKDSIEISPKDDTMPITDSEDEIQEPVPMPNDDGSMEIYSGRDIIPLSDDIIVGQVELEDILLGEPILYDRVIIDGFVFEWILSDYEDDDNIFLEDGVLIISKEDDAENTQVIHVQAEGGWGSPVSLDNKFVYKEVNFDGVPDLLICTGHHGNQGLITYYCFLQTDAGFVEAPTFTDIPNPAVDAENKLILSQWRNTAVSHSWAEFKYQDNAYVLYRELCEEETYKDRQDANEYTWVWTVNGEEIGRSDELSESEIADLLYNENSEWKIADDRWRTIYNNGLTIDGSIYNEP